MTQYDLDSLISAVGARPPAWGPSAEETRQRLIRHEIQLKSIGSLYVLSTFVLLVAAVAMAMPLFPGAAASADADTTAALATGLFLGIFALATMALAVGYRGLYPWVKYPGTLMAVIGLLGIPVGTIINAYILYLVWCQDGREVLDDGYRAIIAATPQVKYQRTLGDKIALAIVVLLVLVMVALLIAGLSS